MSEKNVEEPFEMEFTIKKGSADFVTDYKNIRVSGPDKDFVQKEFKNLKKELEEK